MARLGLADRAGARPARSGQRVVVGLSRLWEQNVAPLFAAWRWRVRLPPVSQPCVWLLVLARFAARAQDAASVGELAPA